MLLLRVRHLDSSAKAPAMTGSRCGCSMQMGLSARCCDWDIMPMRLEGGIAIGYDANGLG